MTQRVLNVGGGSKAIGLPPEYEGWEHVLLDVNPGPDVDIVMDARALKDSDLSGFDALYCSHNLEHYYVHEVPVVLEGFWRVLKPGGTLDIIVPDIGQVIEKLANGYQLEDVAMMSAAGPILYHDIVFGYSKEIASGNHYYAHKTGFSVPRLTGALRAAGFTGGRVMPFPGTFSIRAKTYKEVRG